MASHDETGSRVIAGITAGREKEGFSPIDFRGSTALLDFRLIASGTEKQSICFLSHPVWYFVKEDEETYNPGKLNCFFKIIS